MVHHNPTTNWLLWVNIWPYGRGTISVCYVHYCESRNSFPGFCLYFRHTYFVTPCNGYFCKANKNYKSLSDNQTYQPNMQLILQKNLLRMFTMRHFDSAKFFLSKFNYLWCVILIAAKFNVFKVNNRNMRMCEICSNLTMRIPEWHQLMLFCCRHCELWAYFTPGSSVSIANLLQATVSYDARSPSLYNRSYVITLW